MEKTPSYYHRTLGHVVHPQFLDFFQTVDPQYGSGFMFDSVIATGIGACLARDEHGNVTSESHVQGIRSVNFTGATGPVRFGQGSLTADGKDTILLSSNIGARDPPSVLWGVFNMLPPQPPGAEPIPIVLTHFFVDGEWVDHGNITFADGGYYSPLLLRDLPQQNHVNSGLRATGFVVMGLGMLSAPAACLCLGLH